ncbi:hypothetical protein ACUHGC_01215 [Testudinibacter sp. P27/CKL/0425]
MKKFLCLVGIFTAITSMSTQAKTLEDVGKMTFREFCSSPESYKDVVEAAAEDYGSRHMVARVIYEIAVRHQRDCTDGGKTEVSICDRINELPRKQREKVETVCNMPLSEIYISNVEREYGQ